MSKTSKKNFVTKQLVKEIVVPADNEFIGKILASRGNNLHEVETDEGENFLVSMPTRFRKKLWVRRGTYVILQSIEEGDKVRAEIVHVLDPENIAFLMEKEVWPKRFIVEAEQLTKRGQRTEENDDSDLFPATSESENSAEESSSLLSEDEALNGQTNAKDEATI
ncbi:hypothetical protein niasHT_027995 [Heterodera trifolii]|uniref:Probable RNA-binding protein EIF1AD n=1 Tax=Heterodera trifolii TaxID=157864 RepID=A0ABD2KEQ1_9BILA